MSLINNSDAILDSLDWSGFNTSLDALTLDKPIITLPSKYMRGRHTYAILKILKLEELICSSKNEYVNLSIKLSSEPNFYDSVKKKIKLNKELLFNNYNTIKSLEDFFISQF